MRSLPDIRRVAVELRRNNTLEEGILWERLRGRALASFKFRRQHAMGRFVLDFYCAETRLAVELDGTQHRDPERLLYDSTRTEQLALIQVHVLRFENHEIREDIDRVCNTIRDKLSSLSHHVGEGWGEGSHPRGRELG